MTPGTDAAQSRQVQVQHVGAAANRWRCAFHPARPAEAMLRADCLAPGVLMPVCAECGVAWAHVQEQPALGQPLGAD